ncbi:MAG: hypothetical protein PVF77_17700 [Anaerolineae bacterium]
MVQLRKVMVGLVVLALLAGVWVVPVAAAQPDPQRPRDGNGAKYAYKLALLRLEAQQDRIDHARAAADLAGEYIADEQAAGYDTSILEEALGGLRAKLDEAQGHHDVAAEILEEGAGFDEEGNVTDPRLARETMRDGRRAMRDAQEALREGHRDFREAMREYRESKWER